LGCLGGGEKERSHPEERRLAKRKKEGKVIKKHLVVCEKRSREANTILGKKEKKKGSAKGRKNGNTRENLKESQSRRTRVDSRR